MMTIHSRRHARALARALARGRGLNQNQSRGRLHGEALVALSDIAKLENRCISISRWIAYRNGNGSLDELQGQLHALHDALRAVIRKSGS